MWDYVKSYLPPGPYSRDAVGTVLLPILIALVMLLVDQFGLQSRFMQRYGSALLLEGVDSNHIRFLAQVYFSAFTLLCFVGLPLLFHVLFPPDLDNPFGFRIRSCRPHLPIYLLLLAFMLPTLWLASAQPGFYVFYPMYKPVSLPAWLAYEAVYMLQFFAVEFFFRGFTLFRLESRFGYHAITIMVVPYALLHIHKPFPEALASIVAGLVLGLLALKSRSIWPGVFIHCAVAFCMDWFALIRSGWMAALP
jgi:membrane protease YdiL (CAAX protease family)